MEKRTEKRTKVIELKEKDVKKLQRQQFLEKRRNKVNNRKTLKDFRFSKKDLNILIIIAVGIFVYYILSNYHKIGLVFDKKINSQDAVILDTINADNVLLGYKDNIILFEKSYLKAYNYNGRKEWEKKLEEIYSPEIDVSGDYIQITNNDTGYIYVLDGQYEVGRIKIDGNILSTNINSEGTSVVEYSTSGLKTVLGVYNKKGKELYSLKLNNNTVSTYSMSENSRYLSYVYADISGISLVTKVVVIDLERLSEKNYEFNEIISKNNEMVYKVFWDNNKLHMMFNNYIVVYNASSEKMQEYSISDINATNFDICNGKVAYVTTDPQTSKNVIYVDKYNGKNVGDVNIEDIPKYFIYQDDLIYVCSQKEINVYNKWGTNIKSYNSDMTITKPVIFDNGKCVAFRISNKVIMFKI